ncbi:MAG: hypothetical protein ABW153_04930 [Sedimenticola sp.]
MPVLPSGHVVGITSERARYHATRLNMRVTRDTPIQELYRLVDIVYADAKRGDNDLSQGFSFTGYTVSDYQWINKWKAEDRICFLEWLQQSTQLQVIEGARRKVIYDTLPHEVERYNYPNRLYSVLRRRIAAMEMTSARPAQWRSTILNMKHCGVREDELKWSGVIDFLDNAETEREGNITREELLSRIDFTDIRIELTTELMRDECCRIPFQETAALMPFSRFEYTGIDLAGNDIAVMRYIDPLFNYRIGYIRARGTSGQDARWFVLDPFGKALRDLDNEHIITFEQSRCAMLIANRHAATQYGLRSPLHPSDKYEYMSLHGGEDYREWIVTLPDYHHSHFTPHFTERNVLLHFRTKTRHDNAGNRLLFIEEIQSDWHQQAARKSGSSRWQGKVPQAPFTREWSLLAIKLLLIHAVKNGYDRIAWAPGPMQQMRYQCDMQALHRLYDREIAQHLEQVSKDWNGQVERAVIKTKEPWLSARRSGDSWSVTDRDGRFTTRNKLTKEEAVALCERHTKSIDLEVPVFQIPRGMRCRIAQDALPMFGTMITDKVKKPLCGVNGFKTCDEKTRRACLGQG